MRYRYSDDCCNIIVVPPPPSFFIDFFRPTSIHYNNIKKRKILTRPMSQHTVRTRESRPCHVRRPAPNSPDQQISVHFSFDPCLGIYRGRGIYKNKFTQTKSRGKVAFPTDVCVFNAHKLNRVHSTEYNFE